MSERFAEQAGLEKATGPACSRCGSTDREVARIGDGPWACHPWNCPESDIAKALLALGKIAEIRREIATLAVPDADVLDRYADWCMTEVSVWDERIYPGRWANARERAHHARSRAAALRLPPGSLSGGES